MTQLLYVHVNPVIFMNLTNQKQNMKLFVSHIDPEFVNYGNDSKVGIAVPYISEISFDVIKCLHTSNVPLSKLKEYIDSLRGPITLKVGDILYVPKYDLYKAKSITFNKDQKDDFTKLGLKLGNKIEIGPLSYSKYP